MDPEVLNSDLEVKSDAVQEAQNQEVERVTQALRYEQNVAGGILGGIAAALIAAILWAIITVLTGYQLGYAAIGVGYLVAFGVRNFGKGLDNHFRVIGASLAFFGVVLGNLLALVMLISRNESIPFFTLLPMLNINGLFELLIETSSPIDLLFYGFAIHQAYQLSVNTINSEAIIADMDKKALNA